MKLASKHGEAQRAIIRADFTGGLNTSQSAEDIGENQLADVLNMEVDHTSAKLRTATGTIDILRTPDVYAAIHDSINGVILVVKTNREIYLADFDGHLGGNSLGKLTGELYPKYAAWESGVLIASGGQLQYFNGAHLLQINSPPAEDVFIRAGRVVVIGGSILRYSAVGDETDWREDSNVESASKFAEAGYKDGQKIICAASLSNNILLFKTTGNCYRLVEEYPRWSIVEVATNVECNGRLSSCAVGDDVFILGTETAHLIQNAYYGNVKPEDIAALVKREVRKLPKNAVVKYVAPLSQVWCLGREGTVLIFDTLLKSWYKRQFNSAISDVFSAGEEVYIVAPDRISKLDANTGKDNGEYLNWRFMTQRLVSHHNFLLKRSQVTITPSEPEGYCGHFTCGRVKLPAPRQISLNATSLPQDTVILESRNVYRGKYLDVSGHGQGGGVTIHSIVMDVAEV